MDLPKKKFCVVGTVHCPRGWRAAARPPRGVDMLEVRVDSLPWPASAEEVEELPLPVLVTVRDAEEGGARPLPHELRLSLYLELLPSAAAIDIEVANLRRFARAVDCAKEGRKLVVGSFHDFGGVPTRKKLAEVSRRARDGGADLVKVAAAIEDIGALGDFLKALEVLGDSFAAMGMGRFGAASRMVCAAAGSALNYGWLGSPQVPGQMPARNLAAAFAALSGY